MKCIWIALFVFMVIIYVGFTAGWIIALKAFGVLLLLMWIVFAAGMLMGMNR